MIRKQLSKEELASFDKNFEVEYDHNSIAIEGNTLSLIQMKAVLEDGISLVGKHFDWWNLLQGGSSYFPEQDINHLELARWYSSSEKMRNGG